MTTVQFEYTDQSVGYRKRLTRRLTLTNDSIRHAQEFFFSIGACDLSDDHINVLTYAIFVLLPDICHVSKVKRVIYVVDEEGEFDFLFDEEGELIEFDDVIFSW